MERQTASEKDMTDDNLRETAVIDAMRRRGRRRLVGAIVLALVAVIFVPVLLQKAPEPLGEEVEITIPSPETTVLPQTPAATTQPVATPLPEIPTVSEETPTDIVPPMLPEPSEATVPEAQTSAPEKTVLPKTVALQEGAFSVQLGAYADDKGANAMVNRLKRAGYPAYAEPNMTRAQMVWRVRVGPFKNRSDANTVLTQLRKDRHDGQVVSAR